MDDLALRWDEDWGRFSLQALHGEQVVGSASGRWRGDSCTLDFLAVGEAWRRRGIGRLLVAEVQRRAGCVAAYAVSAAGAGLLAACGFAAPLEPDEVWSWPRELAAGGDRDF